MTGRLRAIAGIIAALAPLAAAVGAAAPSDERAFYTPDELAAIYRHSPLPAPPPSPTNAVANDPRAVALGQRLFFDRRFSANDTVSCATCHLPDRAFTDGRKLAKGLAVGTRNAPTVLNAAFSQWFFLDGRTDSLWSQALKPIEAPPEFGGDRLRTLHIVYDDTALRHAYGKLFGPLPPLADRQRFPAQARPDAASPSTPAARAWSAMAPADRVAADRAYSNLGKAIAAYERKLVSGDSPFDRYVAGLRSGDPAQQAALSPAARRGLKLFVGKANCELCHSGPAFSDGQFHNLGLPLLPGTAPDTGRADGIPKVRADPFNGTGRFSDDPHGEARDRITYLPPPESQLGAFKTPSLRNVALTAPYMHDGRFATLEQVLDFYADGKAASRGRLVGEREATADLVPPLDRDQKAALAAFLRTLTGAPPPPALTTPPARR